MENQRVYLSKKLLENALISLLKQKSLYKISIRELCEVASINRSTFYKYFSSQFDLLNYMENNLLKGIDNILGEPLKGNETLEKSLIKVLKYLKENKEFSKLLLNNNLPILDSSRESKMLENNLKKIKNQEFKKYYQDVLSGFLKASKDLQKDILDNK